MPALIPDLVWLDGRFRRGLGIEYSAETGLITGIASADSLQAGPAAAGPVVRLRDRALLPGFVNAHSHAFQRVMRGRTQWRPRGADVSDFWTWREAMYRAALALGPEDVFAIARFCFLEMLAAGITTVGEFHYLHRDPAGRPYADPAELAHRVIAAAEEVGIRICLLRVAYARGGIDEPLRPEQRRFATPDLEAWLTETVDLLEAVRRRPLVTVGVAPHSIRAVPRHWLGSMHSLAYGLAVPLHMHVSEQPAEVSACLQAYGRRPVEVLAESGIIDEHFTAVNATHLTFREVELLGTPGPTVCACPGAERDVGDGFMPALELIRAGARIALGTDSQTVIEPLQDMRLLEYHERLRRQRRVVLAREEAERQAVAPVLLSMATENGARALRLPAGLLKPGSCADFVAIDLEHRALEGWTDETLDAALTLTAPASVVSDVWVAGVQRVRAGRHRQDHESAQAFRAVTRRLALA